MQLFPITPAIIFYLLSARWAIVYLAQMKPLIVPILSEGEWSYPKWAHCTFFGKQALVAREIMILCFNNRHVSSRFGFV
jgi:hypothetical protein